MPYHPTIVISWNPSTTGPKRIRTPTKKGRRAMRGPRRAVVPNGCPYSLDKRLVGQGTEVNVVSRSRSLGLHRGTRSEAKVQGPKSKRYHGVTLALSVGPGFQ
jgi:hypothetical protein